ncbi:extracellular solute-binding protein [Paenibacillus sp. J5C_2022]|uniref:extracellular solute-binding protein n=1 Tax=Paenibacillus sp. J5C2022 TaxID=2977129 RepID=UPI0021D3616D|nr:extracellular solute-binding protein [Paenibacillus sp. J5C2022]MCU6707877.1 extracellular solute-binding protein [Paenibacillus sp. J5C2022]
MKLQLFKVTLAVIMVFAVLAGCSGNAGNGNNSNNEKGGNAGATDNAGGNSGESAQKEEPVTLKVSFFQGGYGDSWFVWLKEQFEQQYEHVTIELEGNPKMNEIIQPRMESGTNVPDIVFVDDSLMRKWGPAGLLTDITDLYQEPLADGKTIAGTITDSTDNAMDVFGKRYGVPWTKLTQGIIYNVKLFEENGWTYPETWEEMEGLVEQIKAKGIAPFTYPGQYPMYLFPFGHAAYLQYGGPEFIEKLTNPSEEDIPSLYEHAGFKRAYGLLEGMIQEDWMLKGTLALNHTESQMEFLRGKAAMILNGEWLENEMKDALPEGFSMRMMPIPPAADAVVKEPVIESLTSGFGGIPSASKNQEWAKKFLLFTSTEEANRKFTELTGSSRAFTYSVDGLPISDFTKSVLEATNTYKTIALVYKPQALEESPGIDAYSAIASGSKTVDEVVEVNMKLSPDKWKEKQKLLNTQ